MLKASSKHAKWDRKSVLDLCEPLQWGGKRGKALAYATAESPKRTSLQYA